MVDFTILFICDRGIELAKTCDLARNRKAAESVVILLLSALHIQPIRNLREVDIQIIIDIHLNGGFKSVWNAENVSLKEVYSYAFSSWVHNPVLAHAMVLVVIQFPDVIVCWVARRYDLNDEIRCTVAAISVQFVLITDDHNIRLHDGERSVGQFYIKRSREHRTAAAFFLDVRANGNKQLCKDFLVFLGWSCHIVDYSFKYLCADVLRKCFILFQCYEIWLWL